MRKLYALLLILSFNSICFAQFEPDVIVRQDRITSATNIEVGINLINYPCLEPVLNEPHYALFESGSQLELVIVARGAPLCNPIPLDNPPYFFYDIGRLAPGDYALQVRVVFFNTLLIPFANDGFLFGQQQAIHSEIVVIPVFHIIGIVLLLILVILITPKIPI